MRLLLLALAFGIPACAPTPPPAPTPLPPPPEMRTSGRTVEIDGHGTSQSDEIPPLYIGIELVTLSHEGQSSFIVSAVQGAQAEVLTSAIGAYKGQRPLVVQDAVKFQVTADGPWRIQMQPLPSGGKAAFSGTGDDVSPYFTPPAPGVWTISHSGASTFVVYAHCVGGSVLVENTSANVQDTSTIEFKRSPCFWEVRADGAWQLRPPP